MDKDGYHRYDKSSMKVEGPLHVICQCDKCKAQPQRTWVGLTEEELMEMLDYGKYGRVPQYARNFVDAIEAKLKEKNERR